MAVNDIDKAQPKKDLYANIKTKEVMKIDDIEGAKARARVFNRPRDQSFSTINYNDVSGKMGGSTRSTNPLNPTYTVRDEQNNTCEIGPVAGSYPAVQPDAPKDKDRTSLNIKDISGAHASTKGLGVFANAKRQNEPASPNL